MKVEQGCGSSERASIYGSYYILRIVLIDQRGMMTIASQSKVLLLKTFLLFVFSFVSIQVSAAQLSVRVSSSSDDAEESVSAKSVSLSSSDLEMAYDSSKQQLVGMRFRSIAVPKGALITRAYVQFAVNEASSTSTSLVIRGQAAGNANAFTTSSGNISSRVRTSAVVSWSPSNWSTVGSAGSDQRTPDIKAIVQEIISSSTWVSGNSLALIVEGSGRRTAYAYDGSKSNAPLLFVEYTTISSTPTPTPTPIATPAPTPTPSPTPVSGTGYSDDTFSALTSGNALITVSKDFAYSRYEYNAAADGKPLTLDMRASQFIVANSKNENPTTSYDCTQGSLPINTYPATVNNSDFTTFVGGLFNGDQIPQQSDWRPSYCNSAALSFRNAPSGVADGIRITGAWDAVRQAEGSKDLLFKNSWVSNVRDDVVENDFLNNLTVRDVLMDGVFQGVSIRVSSSNTVADSSMNTIVISGSVIKLKPYLIEGSVAFGALFKTSLTGVPKNKVYNTVVAIEPENAVVLSSKNWPYGWRDMIDCKNNVLLWMSDRAIPSELGTIPACFTVVKGQAAKDMYARAKTNWINCHPKLARGADDPESDVSQCRTNEYGGFGN